MLMAHLYVYKMVEIQPKNSLGYAINVYFKISKVLD
jgi:hypothetical protein